MYIPKSLYDLNKYFRFSSQLLNIMKKLCKIAITWEITFLKKIYLTSWFVTQGQKEGGIYLGTWNQDRWLSQQRTHKFEYVFVVGEQIRSLSSIQSKLNFWNQLHPKIAFLCRFLTQTATWRPNHTILTSSVKAILKAMIDTVFLGPSLGGSEFVNNYGRFFQRERVLWGWLAGPCLIDSFIDWVTAPFPPTALRRRHAQTVRDRSSSCKLDGVCPVDNRPSTN